MDGYLVFGAQKLTVSGTELESTCFGIRKDKEIN